MKKILKTILATLSLACVAFGCVACSSNSAYELAVKNGFTGTEKEWLQSLRGENGKDGESVTAADLYTEAQKNGFEGTYIDFCRNELKIEVNEDNDTDTIAKNVTSVVSIYCGFSRTVTTGGGWYGGYKTQTEYYSTAGSGVIIDLDKENGNATIVTNYHVLYDSTYTKTLSDTIYLYTYGAYNLFNPEKETYGDGMRATYAGGSMEYDVAVLKVYDCDYLKNSLATEAVFGASDDVQLGEKVFAIGNPDGAGIAVTSGVISVESEYISMSATNGSGTVNYRVMRTDAAINHGNSGGALFNAEGQLIGITNAKSVEEDVDNMGYALPSTQVKNLCDNILANAAVKVARLGITVETTASSAYYDEQGRLRTQESFCVSLSSSISEKSAAYGNLRTGDVIKEIKINSGETKVLKRQYQLNDALLTVRKGDTVYLTVLRDGIEQKVTIVFDKDSYFDEIG